MKVSEWVVSFTPRPHYSRNPMNRRLPFLKIQFYIILPSKFKSLKSHLLTRFAFLLFHPFHNFTSLTSSMKFSRAESRVRWFKSTDVSAADRTSWNSVAVKASRHVPLEALWFQYLTTTINEQHKLTVMWRPPFGQFIGTGSKYDIRHSVFQSMQEPKIRSNIMQWVKFLFHVISTFQMSFRHTRVDRSLFKRLHYNGLTTICQVISENAHVIWSNR
jgi:hypothetical protein